MKNCHWKDESDNVDLPALKGAVNEAKWISSGLLSQFCFVVVVTEGEAKFTEHFLRTEMQLTNVISS